MKPLSHAEVLMWTHLKELKGYNCAREWKFCAYRRWRFDFVLFNESVYVYERKVEGKKVAIEIDGGVWMDGRHNRGSGYVKELEKFNMATLLGWRVLHFLPSQVLDGSAISFIKRVLEAA